MRWALALMVAGCGGRGGGGDGERFVGRWFVEETEPHGTYGASTYELGADGGVDLVWDAGIIGVPQGHVLSPDGTIRCVFGDAWDAPTSDRLAIAVACDDATSRELVLAFENPASTNGVGAVVSIVGVDGEAGWLPPQWGWSFRKCDPGDDCVP